MPRSRERERRPAAGKKRLPICKKKCILYICSTRFPFGMWTIRIPGVSQVEKGERRRRKLKRRNAGVPTRVYMSLRQVRCCRTAAAVVGLFCAPRVPLNSGGKGWVPSDGTHTRMRTYTQSSTVRGRHQGKTLNAAAVVPWLLQSKELEGRCDTVTPAADSRAKQMKIRR